MKLRKTLFIGALFTILVNVNTVGAWASPSAAKAASAHTNSRWSRHRVQKASDSGCPAMSGDSEVAQRDGDLEEVVTEVIAKPKTPCESAKENTATAGRLSEEALDAYRKGLTKQGEAQGALEDAKKNPATTAEQEATLRANLDRENRNVDRVREDDDRCQQHFKDAKADEAEACGEKPAPETNPPVRPRKPDPNPPALIDEPLEELFEGAHTASFSGASS